MEVEYKMGHLLKVYYDGYAFSSHWPIDIMMTWGIPGFDILNKFPQKLLKGISNYLKSGDKEEVLKNSRLGSEIQCK